MECKKEQNKQHCNCTYSACSNTGICCDCIAYHRSKKQLPACYFDAETEKTYDRSIENFMRNCK